MNLALNHDTIYNKVGNSETVNETSLLTNEVSYTGAISDTTTGLTYMNARYYNPAVGSFTSQDTYLGSAYNPQSQHLYSYTGGNPINFIDPTGHKINWGTLAKGVGLLVLGGIAIASGVGVLAGGGLVAAGFATLAVVGGAGSVVLGESCVQEAFTGENWVEEKIGEDGFEYAENMSLTLMSMGVLGGGTFGKSGSNQQTAPAPEYSPKDIIQYDLYKNDLAYEEAASIFTETGTLKNNIINQSAPIINGTELKNPTVINELTSNGTSINQWSKWATPSFYCPGGVFECHFYMNSITNEINYFEYKSKITVK